MVSTQFAVMASDAVISPAQDEGNLKLKQALLQSEPKGAVSGDLPPKPLDLTEHHT